MRIYATFTASVDRPDEIELVHAWDEFCVDGNPEGYNQTRRAELAKYDEASYARATVTIDVPDDALVGALFPARTPIVGTVSGA